MTSRAPIRRLLPRACLLDRLISISTTNDIEISLDKYLNILIEYFLFIIN
jgi:hypothetical protein